MEKVVIHENWNASNYKGGSDIALVRVDKPIVMFFVSTILKPILFYNDYFKHMINIHQKWLSVYNILG